MSAEIADPSAAMIPKQVIRLASPVLIEQSLLYLVGFSDTMLAGRYLRVESLAAATVGGYLVWFLGSLLMVVSVGATALVSRMIGAGERAPAVKVCGQSIALAWLVGTILLITGESFAPIVVAGLDLKGDSARETVGFLRILVLSMPLMASLTAGVACLRGAGDTRTGMWVMIAVNAVNVSLSWTLVAGIGPFSSLGLRGIAIGTATGEAIGGVIVLIVLARGRSGMKLRPRDLLPDAEVLHRLLRISLPAAGEGLVNSLCQLWFLKLINGLGETATAAHGVAIRCEALAFLTVQAFSVAAATLTGQYLGARRPDLAAKAARTAWGMGALVMTAMGFLIYSQARPMFSIFLGPGRESVIALGVPVLRLVAFALPGLATINVLSGTLRGAGDTRWPLAFVFIGYLGVRLPMTYWLLWPVDRGGLGLGLYGAWIAMLADLTIRGALLGARFLQGGWKSIRV